MKKYLTRNILGLIFTLALGPAQAAIQAEWQLSTGRYPTSCQSASGNLFSDVCANGFTDTKWTLSDSVNGSSLSITFLPAPSVSEGAFLYRVSVPANLQLAKVSVVNGQRPQQKSETSEVTTLVTDKVIDRFYDALSLSGVVFALKLFTADIPVISDPSFLETNSTPILEKKYYPYVNYDGAFTRLSQSQPVTLQLMFNRPARDVLRYLRVMPASFYIGSIPGNELLIEGLKYRPN